MKVLVVPDGSYYIDKNGEVFTDAVYDYDFFSRYLAAFDEVFAVIRAKEVDAAPTGKKKSSGSGVRFLILPQSRGPVEYAKKYFATKKLIKKYVKDFDHAVFRVPGVIPNAVSAAYMRDRSKKFAAEVVVDPWEFFAPGTVKSITRPFVRRLWTSGLKKICKRADGVSYVTERYLQERYPCGAMEGREGCFTEHYSSVELPDGLFSEPKVYGRIDTLRIAHVANSFTGYGKGHLVLMDALKKVLEAGFSAEVSFIGDGPLRPEFEKYAQDLGIADKVHFKGKFPNGTAVRGELRNNDIFVFPTRAEGLPRCVLEAMSEGLPVLASPVCGIPEILPESCLIDYDDPEGYARRLIELINDPSEMTELSRENIATAYEYRTSVLSARRTDFYKKLRGI